MRNMLHANRRASIGISRAKVTGYRLSAACIVAGCALLVAGAACFHHVHLLSCWQCTVVNTDSERTIEERGTGSKQNRETNALIKFRAHIAPLLQPGRETVETIATLRHWTRAQQSSEPQLWRFVPDEDSGDVDPGILLEQQLALRPGACRRFGYILAGALVSAGIPARLVSLQATFSDGFGHIMVEAWVDELGKWILVDPTSDTMFLVDDRYVSLLELRRALLSNNLDRIRFERNGSSLDPPPDLHYFTKIARHAFVYKNQTLFADPPLGKASMWKIRVLHYVDEYAAPYPEATKKALLVAAATLLACSMLLFCAGIALAFALGDSRPSAVSNPARDMKEHFGSQNT